MRRKSTRLKSLSLLTALLLFSGVIYAQTYTSVTSGDWTTAATWDQNAVPGDGDVVVIDAGDVVTLNQNETVNASVTVSNGATLAMGAFVVSGSGTFTVSSGGKIEIGSEGGINSTGSVGSVTTSTRSFNAGGHYVYNRASGSQLTGTGLPTSVAHVTIDNHDGVELTQSTVITTSLHLVDGIFDVSVGYIEIALAASFDFDESITHYYDPYAFSGAGFNFPLPVKKISPSFIYGPVRCNYSGSTTCIDVPMGLNDIDTGYHPIKQCMAHQGTATNKYEFTIGEPTFNANSLHSSVDSVNRVFYYRTQEISVPSALQQQNINMYWFPYDHYSYASLIQGAEWKSGGGGQWTAINANTSISGDSTNGTYYAPNNSQLREFYTIGFGGVPSVPVELVSFDGELVGQDVILKWQTATEINNDYFLIEKSTDGIVYNEIAKVPGSGNSIEILNYMTLDANVEAGFNYYRLTQVDFDLNSETFDPIVVDTRGLKSTRIISFPNPSKGAITVTLPEMKGNGDLEIVDIHGKQVYSKSVEAHQDPIEINISAGEFPRGIYYVRFGNLNDGFITEMIQLL